MGSENYTGRKMEELLNIGDYLHFEMRNFPKLRIEMKNIL